MLGERGGTYLLSVSTANLLIDHSIKDYKQKIKFHILYNQNERRVNGFFGDTNLILPSFFFRLRQKMLHVLSPKRV